MFRLMSCSEKTDARFVMVHGIFFFKKKLGPISYENFMSIFLYYDGNMTKKKDDTN